MGKTTGYPVKSLISFDALENPPWHASTRTNGRQAKTVTEMITQIKEYHMRWEQAIAENTYNEELVKKVSLSNACFTIPGKTLVVRGKLELSFYESSFSSVLFTMLTWRKDMG